MDTPSLGEMLPRLFLSMGVVIIVMAIAARALRDRKLPGSDLLTGSSGKGKRLDARRAAGLVQVLARHGLGRNASVQVVRAGDRVLVLGVTEQNIQVLTELDQVDLDEEPQAHGTGDAEGATLPGPAWTGLLTQVRERTLRR